jgi:phage gpG-like protein
VRIALEINKSPKLKKALAIITADKTYRKLTAKIGAYVETRVKLRTAQGMDFNEKKFTPYKSKGHKKKRKEAGLPTSTVDLMFKGNMMAALTHKVIGSDTALIHFSDAQQAKKAHGHNHVLPKSKPRKFMGINQRDVKKINDMVANALMGRN